MTETKIYRGKIVVRDHGESPDVLFVDDGSDQYDQEPLAEQIADHMDADGRWLSVNYYITDEEHPKEELQEEWLRHVIGATDAEFTVAWSDVTGYLWTDENIVVGGHDLLAELVSHAGKFIHMEITYAKEPQ